MTVETTVLPGEDPYEGLRELTAKVWALVLKKIERLQAWRRMHPITGGAPGLLDEIRNFLWNIVNFLRPWDLFQWLRWRVFDPFQGWLREHLFGRLIEHLYGLLQAFLGWWGGALHNLNVLISRIPTVIYNALISLPGTIANIFRGIYEGLKAGISADLWLLRQVWERMPSWVRDPIERAWQQLTGHIRTLWDVFGGYFNRLREAISGAISGASAFLHNPLEGLRQIWQRFQQSWAGQLLSSLISSMSALWNMVIAAIRELWSEIHPKIVEAAERAITFARPYIERWVGAFQQLPATYLNYVATMAGTDLALTPSRSLAVTGSLYMMSIVAGSAAMTLATGLNLIPATNWVGAQQFAAFIAEAAGFEPLTRATYGVLLNECLTMPLRYHWNFQLRPKIPTEGALLLMGRKRGLSEAEWRLSMAYQGIPDWYLNKIYLFNWTDPSPFWVSRVTEAHIPDWHPDATWGEWADQWMPGWRADPFKWVRAKLLLAGYERADVDSMIEAIHAKLMASPITQVKTSVRAMLRDDYWTRVDAQGALRPLAVREEEIELMYLAERLDYQKEYLDDQVMYYKERFRKGEIDEQDLGLALSTIYVSPERVAQEVARERVRALPKPKAITEPKEDPLVVSLRRQAVTSWTKAYRDWKIEEEDLLLGLVIVLQDRDLATELVEVEKTRYREPPVVPPPPPEPPEVAKARRQAIASWVTAFRAGEIKKGELELYLEPLIPEREIRLQVVELENLRYRPTPDLIPPPSEDPDLAKIRQEYVRGHIEEFQKRLIGLEQLYAFLLADGLVEPLARATVITQANKRIKVPAIDSPYFLQDIIRDLIDQGLLAYEELYMEEKITIDQYTAWLTSIAADPDVVTYLADTLTLRRFLEGL